MSSHAESADAGEPSDDVAEDGNGGPVADEAELPHPPPTATEEPDTKPLSETDHDETPDSPGVG